MTELQIATTNGSLYDYLLSSNIDGVTIKREFVRNDDFNALAVVIVLLAFRVADKVIVDLIASKIKQWLDKPKVNEVPHETTINYQKI